MGFYPVDTKSDFREVIGKAEEMLKDEKNSYYNS